MHKRIILVGKFRAKKETFVSEIDQDIIKTFGNRLRLRVSGISIIDNKILLVKHTSMGQNGVLYAPPGGGLSFGESVGETLIRELQEETNLTVIPGRFLFVNEYLDPPLHAIELFFEISVKEGLLNKGFDPEMPDDKQIISEVGYYSINQIKKGNPQDYHSVLNKIADLNDLFHLPSMFLGK